LVNSSPDTRLRWLPWLFAAGAVFWLIQLTQFAAVLAAPAGREQLQQTLVHAGFTTNPAGMLVVETVLIVFFEVAAAVLHGAAYYGLRRFRPWGWAAAFVVSLGWSLVILGIPVLAFLVRRRTRAAYGVP
jgi:hypothetical protein